MSETVIRYRIHTEHVAPSLIAKYFEGFSIIKSEGYYKGVGELSVIIEILGGKHDLLTVITLAQVIRERYQQDEVWITAEEVSVTRVSIDAVKEGF